VLAALLLLWVGSAGAAAQEPSAPAPERVRATGIVAGVVRTEAGAPIADARVMIEGFARQARTGDDGRFLLEGVAPGVRELIVRKLGFREARAALRVPADSAVNVAITLVSAPQQLPGVVVEVALFNQVAGLIIDERDRPIPNVMVEIVGLGRRFETRDDGGFLLVDLDPGHYLLQFRKQGYTVAQYGLHMVREIDREFTVRLRPSGDSRLTPELAAVVALEANRRQSMKGARAAVISRDELARFRDAPLAAALLESPAGLTLRETGSSCILINGHESATIGTTGSRVSVTSGRRGPTSFGGGGSNTRVGGNRTPPGGSVAMSGFRGGWLDFFKADEVEMVEIYPEGTENSRTLCGRFPPSSGCACPPDPAGIVIWLRQ
jgi:hypothetical protein